MVRLAAVVVVGSVGFAVGFWIERESVNALFGLGGGSVLGGWSIARVRLRGVFREL